MACFLYLRHAVLSELKGIIMNRAVFIPLIFMTIGFIFLASGCDHNPNDGSPTIPDPEIVSEVETPPFTDAVYYKIAPASHAGDILGELLENDFEPKQAWHPIGQTPCDCATCVTAFVVELRAPDGRILDFQFISDAAPWVINCGIDSFEHYDFTQ